MIVLPAAPTHAVQDAAGIAAPVANERTPTCHQETGMPQAFSGLCILDFTQVLAGPFATQQFALLGADVIKIEQPGAGDQTRGLMNARARAGVGMSPSFLTCNLGKRSLALDLKAP
jgi:crotonobetainyl-CoA:carnitine CoA-transferase CaiB-like acyl-CoA transferase